MTTPQVLGERYQIGGVLGRGGMAEVHRGRDLRLNREVAVKVLPAALSSDRERLRRFEQEARATAALNHPNILAVFDVGSQDHSPSLASQTRIGSSTTPAPAGAGTPVR